LAPLAVDLVHGSSLVALDPWVLGSRQGAKGAEGRKETESKMSALAFGQGRPAFCVASPLRPVRFGERHRSPDAGEAGIRGSALIRRAVSLPRIPLRFIRATNFLRPLRLCENPYW